MTNINAGIVGVITGVCDKCGLTKALTSGRCDDCFELYGDPIDEISTGISAFAMEEKPKPIVEKVSDPEPVLLLSGQFSLFDVEPIVEESKKANGTKGSTHVVVENKEEEDCQTGCGADEENISKSPAKATGAKTSAKAAPAKSTGTTPATKAATSKYAPKKQDLEVEADWTVHYARQSFRVGDFFNPFPASGKVTLEQLREKMELEFFEMTKARTKWDYEEDLKRLYPDVTGTSKGVM